MKIGPVNPELESVENSSTTNYITKITITNASVDCFTPSCGIPVDFPNKGQIHFAKPLSEIRAFHI